MIDYFALALAHGLLVIAFLRLTSRDALDSEEDRAPAVAADSSEEQAPRRSSARYRHKHR